MLINLYNAHTETGQARTLTTLSNILKGFDMNNKNQWIFSGDVNLLIYNKREAWGGNPKIKKLFLGKLIQFNEGYKLSNIWKVRNKNKRRYSFRKNHNSGFIQGRLDYIYVSNSLQENVKTTDIFNAFPSDHSPVFLPFTFFNVFFLSLDINFQTDREFLKFNNLLVLNDHFVNKMENHI